MVVDPGIGFGKSLDENVTILRRLERVLPAWVVRCSSARRGKRFLGTLSGVGHPQDRDVASIAAHLIAVQRGATAIRVHDVAGHAQALAVWAALDIRRTDPDV